MPADAGTWLHAAERVHFVLFVTTIFYFASLGVAFFIYRHKLLAYSKVEKDHAEGTPRRFHHHDVSPPVSCSEGLGPDCFRSDSAALHCSGI